MEREASTSALDPIMDLLCCPQCGGDLELSRDGGEESMACVPCRRRFPVSGNVPLLYWHAGPDRSRADVTEAVKAFYEKTPFPNYDECDDVGSLIQKARRGIFARLLDEQIPFGCRILECGCGTGQLSNFLSVAGRTVIGTDISLNSLKLAQEFKERNHLRRAYFLQMNLFQPVVKRESIDLVICNGVLHHTADPYLGFRSIARLVKPNGYILIGLYHKYARLLTDFRRCFFRLDRGMFEFLDSRSREGISGEKKKNAWFADQYMHPHESKHTIREVRRWFLETGFEFVTSVPRSGIFSSFQENERIFQPEKPGAVALFARELLMSVTHSHDGGLFMVIGKKKV
jgi:SAM-dependent methyltransferase